MVSVTKFLAVFAIIVLIGFGFTNVEAKRRAVAHPTKATNPPAHQNVANKAPATKQPPPKPTTKPVKKG